ncbi:alpha/beta hydrolase domain-containing protein [Aldersonia kunmingensis]|uniref:alpha/beta hydrolase domain-containing protein n=1 Tax=Aldersonia kunmingensis TaxID=408066 RepID=UPI000831A2D3|nr:alpha/beta hydrolase domain-containing protein [Aldersonia kunmingensis]
MTKPTVFEELTGGKGASLLAANPGPDLATAGYRETEYRVSGSATCYRADDLPVDGRFVISPASEEAFSTRLLVRRPVDPATFNGTVVVEWFNVSSGSDAGPDYTYLYAELLRRGYAWAGVSAQLIGVEGGRALVSTPNAAGSGLKQVDPDRYGTLSHPGDEFAYDIFTSIGRALGSGADDDPLGGLKVERRLAVGESQSAFAMSTYVNAVAPISGVFDGFLIHSRAGGVAPIGEIGTDVDLARAKAGPPTRIRDDLSAPVIVVQTETDLFEDLAYYPARQPDSDFFRLWEIAGTAHADRYQIGDLEEFLGCPQRVNRGQQTYVLRAALRHLDAWSRGGSAAPSADRLSTRETDGVVEFAPDANGNTEGGIRTPAVDAPVSVLSGFGPADSSRICRLFGTTTPLDGSVLRALYSSRADYLDRYRAAAEAAITAGYVLAEDREALLAEAEPDLIPD